MFFLAFPQLGKFPYYFFKLLYAFPMKRVLNFLTQNASDPDDFQSIFYSFTVIIMQPRNTVFPFH